MKTLLQITSSIYADAGQSTGLAKRYAHALARGEARIAEIGKRLQPEGRR